MRGSESNAGRAGSGLAAARTLFSAARFSECLAALGDEGGREPAFLRARCLLRLGMPADAVSILQHAVASEHETCARVEHAVLLSAAFAALGDGSASQAWLSTAASLDDTVGGAATADVHLLRAAASLRDGDLAPADEWARRALSVPALRKDRYGTPLGVVRAQAFELLSAIAAAREDYAAQAEFLQSGWQSLYRQPHEKPDRFVEARLLEQLAPLALELRIDAVTPQLHAAIMQPWPRQLANAEWTIRRTLAWQAALAGDERTAFAYLLDCVSSAPSDTQRLASIADRAELAHEIGNDVIAYEERRRMSVLARDVDWALVHGESRSTLLAIAKAFALDDADVARGWLSVYRRHAARASIAGTRRRCALESDAQAAVLEAESHADDALRMRRQSLAQWNELGYRWRAAREALAIARLSQLPGDVAAARKQCAAFPKSWLARGARRLANGRRSR